MATIVISVFSYQQCFIAFTASWSEENVHDVLELKSTIELVEKIPAWVKSQNAVPTA